MNASRTILLVEDNEDDVFIFRRALKKAQIMNPLQLAADGQQAVDYLAGKAPFNDRAAHPLPFIVFLDLKLPYLGGFEVLAWIRSRPELVRLPVVVLTSSPEENDHKRAYSLGARSYLVKPPAPQMLLELAGSLETHWAAAAQPDPFQIGAAAIS